jgi:uncharacterized protein YxjI
MVIEIIPKTILINKKYEIGVDGGRKYRVSGITVPLFGGSYEVVEENGNRCASIKRSFYLIVPNYSIVLSSGTTLNFAGQSLFQGVYSCGNENSQYVVYAHKGLIASIYKDDRQVAALMKGTPTGMRGDYYSLLADDDADALVLTCVGVVLESCLRGISVTVNGVKYNLGSIIIRRDHPLDESWQPKLLGRQNGY